MRGATIEKKCACCKSPMTVRLADHNRGWGKFCSKSCKAKKPASMTSRHEQECKALMSMIERRERSSHIEIIETTDEDWIW